MSTTADEAFLAGMGRVAKLASVHADEVDREARFPHEAVHALRDEGSLSALVPTHLGGADVSLSAVAAGCLELGTSCSATAMVFAMHTIQVSSLARHLDDAPWFTNYLARSVQEQRLISSVTSEVQTGGDLGSSAAAVQAAANCGNRFEKQAPTVSYGAYADDLLTTLRRHDAAEPGDQVLVLTSREQTELEPVGRWDTLGMRGTCSPGFVVRARMRPEQVLPTPFARVSAESMVPVSHILWSHAWLGIATDAFARARAFVRAGAQRMGGSPPPSAEQLTRLHGLICLLRATVANGLGEFCRATAGEGRAELSTMAYALRSNALKLTASELTPQICEGALAICGISGFRNDTPYSVGRHLRDAMSAQVMVANSRIRASNAGLLLVVKEA